MRASNALGSVSVCGDSASRFHDWKAMAVAAHLLYYPLELLGCALPWSLLLIPYGFGGFRRALGEIRPVILFPCICLAVAFPTCWIPPDSNTRYMAPLYPCLAVLIGLVAERCGEAAVGSAWRRYVTFMASVMFPLFMPPFCALA